MSKPSFKPDFTENLHRIAAAGARVLDVSLKAQPLYTPHCIPRIDCVTGYTQLPLDALLGLPDGFSDSTPQDGPVHWGEDHETYLEYRVSEGDNPLLYIAMAGARIGGAAYIADMIDGVAIVPWNGLTVSDIRSLIEKAQLMLQIMEQMKEAPLADSDSLNSISENKICDCPQNGD